MAVFFRGRGQPEQRATKFNQLPVDVQKAILGISTGSYADINLTRAEDSLQSVAYRAAADLLASLVSELPFDVFRGRGTDKVQIELAGTHPLNDPDGSDQGIEDWVYQAMMSWLLRGNLFGRKLDAGPGGVLRQVELFHPDAVTPSMDDGVVQWQVNGRDVPATQFLHRRVNPIPGLLLGLSPVAYHASTLKVNLASTRYGQQWFEEGAHPSGVLSNELAEIDRDQARSIKDRFMEALRGTRDPVVLGKGWKWNQLQINPEESQFLETQGFSAAECARILGPGIAELLGYSNPGGTLTYSNLVDRDLLVLKYSANRWLRRMERLLSMFLPRPQYVRFNRNAFLQTNTMQRYQAHQIALASEFATVNEVRELEDKKPVPWGDVPARLSAGADGDPDSDPGDDDNEMTGG